MLSLLSLMGRSKVLLCQFQNFIAGDVPCALFGTVDLSGLRSGFVDASFGRRHLSDEREHNLT